MVPPVTIDDCGTGAKTAEQEASNLCVVNHVTYMVSSSMSFSSLLLNVSV